MLELIGIILGLVGIWLGWVALSPRKKEHVKERIKKASEVVRLKKSDEESIDDYRKVLEKELECTKTAKAQIQK